MFLERHGFKIVDGNTADAHLSMWNSVQNLLPDSFFSANAGRKDRNRIKKSRSNRLDTDVVAVLQNSHGTRHHERVFPLLYEGSLDGDWYVVFNGGKNCPHQLSVLLAILHPLGMLVRYYPVEWRKFLRSGSGGLALVEEIIRVAKIKIPILVTELLLRRWILGDIERIP